jgi:hypothetical protein
MAENLKKRQTMRAFGTEQPNASGLTMERIACIPKA